MMEDTEGLSPHCQAMGTTSELLPFIFFKVTLINRLVVSETASQRVHSYDFLTDRSYGTTVSWGEVLCSRHILFIFCYYFIIHKFIIHLQTYRIVDLIYY